MKSHHLGLPNSSEWYWRGSIHDAWFYKSQDWDTNSDKVQYELRSLTRVMYGPYVGGSYKLFSSRKVEL